MERDAGAGATAEEEVEGMLVAEDLEARRMVDKRRKEDLS